MTSVQWQATHATFSHLSQELLDEIVDYGEAFSVPDFFRNCSLVCRSLHSRAQKHIYKDISVRTTQRVQELSAHIIDNPLISSYLKNITTTAEQLDINHGLRSSFALLLSIIKMHSPNSSISLFIYGGDSLDVGSCVHTYGPTCDYTEGSLPECLSIVTSLELQNIRGFPIMLLSHLRRLTELIIIDVSFDYARFPASFPFDSLRLFAVKNTEDFPGVLIRMCTQLQMLEIQHVSFSDVGIAAVRTPLPQTKHVYTSHLRYKTIKMLVDSLADLSYLCGALDTTRFAHICENADESVGDAASMQYLLRSCHDSLRHLQLNCKTETYSLEEPQVICSLSQFVNLRELRLDFFCIDNDDAEFTAPYLRDILKTILPHGHVLERIEITLYLELKPCASSDSGLPELNFHTLPYVFLPAGSEWNEAREVLTALATKDDLCIVFTVHTFGPGPNARYKHFVFPTTEEETFRCLIENWAWENLEPAMEGSRNQVFQVKTHVKTCENTEPGDCEDSDESEESDSASSDIDVDLS